MAKRFTDTNKWRKPFIRGLQGAYKLFWFYILDDCDHAGIWIVDMEVANIRTGQNITEEDALKIFESKITVFDNGERWFIQDFIDFQYGILNDSNRAHKSVINILLKYKLLNKDMTLISPLQGVKDKDKDKELDKDKVKKGVRGKCLMRNSGVTQNIIADAFSKSDDLGFADPKYYYNTALAWSDSKGEMRVDWIATVSNFARRDIKDGKMKVKKKTREEIEKPRQDFGIPSPTAVPMPDSMKKSISRIGKG